MSYLSIDLGDKRCGVAISSQGIAFPKAILKRSELMNWLKKYVNQNNVSYIVVGLPYDLYGRDTRQLDKTQKFIKKLECIFPDIKVIGHDERFSSFQASDGFNDHRDDIAAQCILQSYLDSIS